MDIKTGSAGSSLARIYGPGVKASPAEKTGSSSGTPASAKVSISSTSQLGFQQTDADVRMEKVQALRAALADGTLVISPERIADGLIDSARELLGK